MEWGGCAGECVWSGEGVQVSVCGVGMVWVVMYVGSDVCVCGMGRVCGVRSAGGVVSKHKIISIQFI